MRPGSEIVVKNAVARILGNARSLIFDGKDDMALAHLDAHFDHRPGRGGLNCVAHQVPEYLSDLRTVASRKHGARRAFVNDTNVGTAVRVRRKGDDLVRERGHVGW